MFRSAADLVGANPNQKVELFRANTQTGLITQLTHLGDNLIDSPAMSDDGNTVVFSSSADPLSSNPDRNQEIFSLDVNSGVMHQLTNTTGAANESPSISGDGQHIVFGSSADPQHVNNFNYNLYELDSLGLRVIGGGSFAYQSASGANEPAGMNFDGSDIVFNHVLNGPDLFSYRAEGFFLSQSRNGFRNEYQLNPGDESYSGFTSVDSTGHWAVASWPGVPIQLFDLSTADSSPPHGPVRYINGYAASINGSGSLLAYETSNGTMSIESRATAEVIATVQMPPGLGQLDAFNGIGFSRQSTAIAIAGSNGVGVVRCTFSGEPPPPPAPPTTYAALGDSFSSGEGNPPFQVGTDVATDKCHRSNAAYPSHVTVVSPTSFVACSGAKLVNLSSSLGGGGGWNEPAQLSALGLDTGLVTMTIGGNDVGFGPIAQDCAIDTDCLTTMHALGPDGTDVADYNSRAIYPDLVKVYQEIRNNRTNDAPTFALGYPQFLPASTGDETSCALPYTQTQLDWVRQHTATFDHYLADAAEAAGVHYVDTSILFAGHEACTDQAWVNTITPRGSGSLHPNALGQEVLAHALNSAIGGGLANPNPQTPSDPPSATGSPVDLDQVLTLTDAIWNTVQHQGPVQEAFHLGGWAANALVHFFLHSSTPVDLGTVSADSNGVIDTSVAIPADTPPGPHLITAEGTAADSNHRFVVAPVTVANPPDPPGGATGTAGDGQVTVSWSAPLSDGGSPITGYTASASPGGQTCTWTVGPLSCAISGLANGTAYTFTVAATNETGDGHASTPSNSVTPAGVPGTLTMVMPSRILDTRSNNGLSGTFRPQQTRDLKVTAVGGVPQTGVDAVILNVTATRPTANGWLTLFPADAPTLPTASNLNFTAGQTVPNLVVVRVGHGGASEGKVSISNTGGNAAAGTVDVVADVVGWYSNTLTPPPPAGRFTGVTPARIIDTRTNVGLVGHFNPQATRDLVIGGQGGVPLDADSVVMNVTATNPSAGGWLTVSPTGQAVPTASNLNFATGQSVANLVTVKLGTTGKVSITNTGGIPSGGGTVDVIGDIVGYYKAGVGAQLTSIAPQRILDTRMGTGGPTGPVAAQGTITVDPHTASGIPPAGSYAGVIVNVTATSPAAGGWLTVYPSDGTLPTASNLNFAATQTVANLVKIRVGPDGNIKITNTGGITGGGSVQIIADIVGYYTSS